MRAPRKCPCREDCPLVIEPFKRINNERKIIDLDKPLTPGAFADVSKLKVYTEEDYILPETPPFAWLLRTTNQSCKCKPKIPDPEPEDDRWTDAEIEELLSNNNMTSRRSLRSNDVKTSQSSANDVSAAQSSSQSSDSASASTKPQPSRWYQPVQCQDKVLKEMHFPFATNRNSRTSELANFIRSCIDPPKLQQYEEATPDADDNIDDITKQLEQFETNLIDYDSLVASLTLPPLDDNSNS